MTILNLLIIFSFAQSLFIAQDDNNDDVSDLDNELTDIEKHKKIKKSSVIRQSFAQSRRALLFPPLRV